MLARQTELKAVWVTEAREMLRAAVTQERCEDEARHVVEQNIEKLLEKAGIGRGANDSSQFSRRTTGN